MTNTKLNTVLLVIFSLNIACSNEDRCVMEVDRFKMVDPFYFTDENLNGIYILAIESLNDLPDSLTKDINIDSVFLSMSNNKIDISNELMKIAYSDPYFLNMLTGQNLRSKWEQTTDKYNQAGLLVTYMDSTNQMMFGVGFDIASTNSNLPVLLIQTTIASDQLCGKILLIKQN